MPQPEITLWRYSLATAQQWNYYNVLLGLVVPDLVNRVTKSVQCTLPHRYNSRGSFLGAFYLRWRWGHVQYSSIFLFKIIFKGIKTKRKIIKSDNKYGKMWNLAFFRQKHCLEGKFKPILSITFQFKTKSKGNANFQLSVTNRSWYLRGGGGDVFCINMRKSNQI